MDTFGWDVVCAVSCDKANELLALQFAKRPASLSYDDGAGTTISATFDPWKIVAGGSDKILRMELPIKSGTMTSPNGSIMLDGAAVVAEIKLAFIKDAKSSVNNLKFDIRSVASNAGDTADGSIFIVDEDVGRVLAKRDPSNVAAMTLHDCIPSCLIANSAKLDYIFAALNLTPTGAGSWLAAQDPRYLYVQGPASTTGYLAILSMVSSVDTSAFQSVIDTSLCDGKSDVYLAIAPHVFLEHVVMPHVSTSYVGATSASFQMRGDSIFNIGPLVCPTVNHWGTGYIPILSSLQISVAASQIQSKASGAFDITGLAKSSVTFSESGASDCAYDASTGKLTVTPHGNPQSDHDTHIPWYIYASCAPFIAVLGPLIPGIVAAIVDGVIAGVTAAVANSVPTNTGNLALSDWSAQAIEFPGASRWTINNAALSDAFYMRCKLHS